MRAVLDVAQSHLHEQQTGETGGRNEVRADRRAPRKQVPDQEHQAAAEHRDRGAVEQQRRMQRPEPVHVLPARVRAGGGRDRPRRNQRETCRHDPEPGEPWLTVERPSVPVDQRYRLEADDYRRAQHGDREQQVGDDERRVQVRVDGDRAERRLGQRAREGSGREPAGPARQAACGPGAGRERQREDDRHTADQPVPELDVGVIVLLGKRLPGRTAGPVLAPEPGARQPNDRAGGDDQPERGDRDECEPAERRRG